MGGREGRIARARRAGCAGYGCGTARSYEIIKFSVHKTSREVETGKPGSCSEGSRVKCRLACRGKRDQIQPASGPAGDVTTDFLTPISSEVQLQPVSSSLAQAADFSSLTHTWTCPNAGVHVAASPMLPRLARRSRKWTSLLPLISTFSPP